MPHMVPEQPYRDYTHDIICIHSVNIYHGTTDTGLRERQGLQILSSKSSLSRNTQGVKLNIIPKRMLELLGIQGSLKDRQ